MESIYASFAYAMYFIFCRMNELTHHEVIHSGQSFNCRFCGKGFKSPVYLKQHMRGHCPKDKIETPSHKKRRKTETTCIKATHSSVQNSGCTDSVPTNLGDSSKANNHNLLTTIDPNRLGFNFKLGSFLDPYL